MSGHVLAARLDNAGDVLLTGPAVRAIAADADRVTFLAGPAGRAAAELLPGVDEVITFDAPWVAFDPAPVDRHAVLELVDLVAARGVDRAFVFTSFHQSPLPLALLLRMAGVPELAAISIDYPGALLDVRHRVDDDIHEVERSLSLVATLGHRLPGGDDGRLAIRRTGLRPPQLQGLDRYVVVHPGASVPARAWSPWRNIELVGALTDAGWPVVVTGSPSEGTLTAAVTGPWHDRRVVDLGGATDLAELAEVLAGASAVVVGNTGPAHLAAAVGAPVVSLFSPVVPAVRWRPWGVPLVLLGDQSAPCAGSRARDCPIAGHPCLDQVTPDAVVTAVASLAGAPADPAAQTPLDEVVS